MLTSLKKKKWGKCTNISNILVSIQSHDQCMGVKYLYLLMCISDPFYNRKTLKTGDEDLIGFGENQPNKQKPNKALLYNCTLSTKKTDAGGLLV